MVLGGQEEQGIHEDAFLALRRIQAVALGRIMGKEDAWTIELHQEPTGRRRGRSLFVLDPFRKRETGPLSRFR